MEKLKEHLSKHRIDYTATDDTVTIGDIVYQLIQPASDGRLFDLSNKFVQEDIHEDNVIFNFGGLWYYSKADKFELNNLSDIGENNYLLSTNSFFGVHGGFEILTGSRQYKDWVKKAKFLGVKSLAICEKRTLAGVLKFQTECKKAGIKSIIGMQVEVNDDVNKPNHLVNLYVTNKDGWDNLLRINKWLNVDNLNQTISTDVLSDYMNGLVCIYNTDSISYDDYISRSRLSEYYALSMMKYKSKALELKHLQNLKKFVNDYNLMAFNLTNAYYIDRDDSRAKAYLKKIAKLPGKIKVTDEYFCSNEDLFFRYESISDNHQRLVEASILLADAISETIDFSIPTGERHLPKYKMTDDEIAKYGKDGQIDLFWDIVNKGFDEKVPKGKEEIYRNRVNTEFEVLEYGDVINYFLIMWDIISWARAKDILVGVGRGSAAGSLISYLMDITRIDPIDFGLMFDRFLTKGRVSKSLPDIDTDYEGKRRGEVKQYMIDKYGEDYFCSVGTYTNLKPKSLIKEIGKIHGNDYDELNYVTTLIKKADDFSGLIDDIQEQAKSAPQLKNFIKEHTSTINETKLIIGQPKAKSIHACATIIVPDDKTIHEYLPMQVINKQGHLELVSQWEGIEIESAGFLKEDVLGIALLDKYAMMVSLIKSDLNKDLDIYSIPLDDNKVYDFYKKGWNSDIFHFGSVGLTEYCKEMQPDNMGDLSAALSLYRPGPMENGFHKAYIKRKNGENIGDPYPYCEHITEETYHLLVYQEQIMKICSALGGFTEEESDDVRAALGKKKLDKLEVYKPQFINNATKINGVDIDVVEGAWSTMEEFAKYSFNKCISGKESFKRLKGKGSFAPNIEEMYKIKNDIHYAKSINKKELHFKYKHRGYGKGYSLYDDGNIKYNNIVDIRYVGVKPTYKVVLSNGKSIVTTDNHKFPTSNGEKMLKDINIKNDLLYIYDGYKQNIWKGKDFHKKELSVHNSKKGHVGFHKKEERSTNNLKLKYYKENLKKNYCEICGCKDSRLEVHHIDGNHYTNNEPQNLITLCVSCHRKEHYSLGRVKAGTRGTLSKSVKIRSIEFYGNETVYDVEMDNPAHNFVINNGIVTSNSHSVSYAVLGYYGQWIKVNYPLQYWATAFTFSGSNKKEITRYMSEINQIDDITIKPVNINLSGATTISDVETNSLYWSLNSVKQCGDKAYNQIVNDREENGEYLSFDNFLTRNVYKGSKVNKASIENLIICGAFDEVEMLIEPIDRIDLIAYYYRYKASNKLRQTHDSTDSIWLEMSSKVGKKLDNIGWLILQRDLCGFAFFDYNNMARDIFTANGITKPSDFVLDGEGAIVDVGGYVKDWELKRTRAGKEMIIGSLDANYEDFKLVIWSDAIEKHPELRDVEAGNIVFFNGKLNDSMDVMSHKYSEVEIIK